MNPNSPRPDVSAALRDGASYIRSEHFMLREVAGEALMVPLPSSGLPGNAMVMLNETSLFLLKLLAEPHSLAEVLEKAHEEYDDPEGLLETHIRDFITLHLKTRVIKEV